MIPPNFILIDDDYIVNKINEKYLLKLIPNASITAFNTANTAIEHILSINDYEGSYLIFLDINMPGIDGFEFMEILEANHNALTPKIFICMLSGSIDENQRIRAESYSKVISFMAKPISQSKLADFFFNNDILKGEVA